MLDAQMIVDMFWIAIAMMNDLDQLSENQATTLNGYAELFETAIDKLAEDNRTLRGDLHGTALDNDKLSRENVRLESELRMKEAILANVQKANEILHANIAQLTEPVMRRWFQENILLVDLHLKISAIKYYRTMFNSGLLEAKNYVEGLMDKLFAESLALEAAEDILVDDYESDYLDDWLYLELEDDYDDPWNYNYDHDEW